MEFLTLDWINTYIKIIAGTLGIFSFVVTFIIQYKNLKKEFELHKENFKKEIDLLITSIQNNQEGIKSNKTSITKVDKNNGERLVRIETMLLDIKERLMSK